MTSAAWFAALAVTNSTLSQHLLYAFLAAGILSGCGKSEVASPTTPPPAAQVTNAPPAAAAGNPAFAKLSGKWRRPDGGYLIEIRSVDADGKLDAGYFNPQPINVAKAVAFQEGGRAKVFIELRAPNYPGSTYTLTHEPAADQLVGEYFQAALKETFDVSFERVKP